MSEIKPCPFCGSNKVYTSKNYYIDGKLSAYDAIKTAAKYQEKTIESAVRMLAARRQHPINSRTFRYHLETGTARFADVKHTMELLGFRLEWKSIGGR